MHSCENLEEGPSLESVVTKLEEGGLTPELQDKYVRMVCVSGSESHAMRVLNACYEMLTEDQLYGIIRMIDPRRKIDNI
jgi:hypothetical protein